ncbi:CpsD/CapB family tyrosine-protein kinase [Ramlibacter sp. AN1015]|uniref:CpsD/CapB family tyrosine-protein kinase n=1 Tax=Ramlibacter sp. AN1015 TaxID=3133428 RepID=UPI0030BBAB99
MHLPLRRDSSDETAEDHRTLHGANLGSDAHNENTVERRRPRGDCGGVEPDHTVWLQRDRRLGFGDAPINGGSDAADMRELLAMHLRAPAAPSPKTFQGDPELVVMADPSGYEAEVFRELRTELIARARQRASRAALAIVSPSRREGKSYTAANLSACFAQLGGRTLLIDADLRTPRLQWLLGSGEHGGLSGILRGDEQAFSSLQPVAQVPGLFFLPAGAVPRNPVELLQSPRFSLLLRELLLKFDQVVLDTPADAWGADARVIAAQSGSALIVGRKGHSAMADLRRLVARIADAPSEIAGVVINRC